MASLKERVVVITGGSAGIGAALAREVSSRGASVVLVARREAVLKEVAATLKTPSEIVVGDVTVRADHERALKRAIDRFGHVDVWVNNAGRAISRPVLQLTDEDVDIVIRDDVKSVIYGMQTVVPHFQSRNSGQLMNVSSMLGRIPFAAIRSMYCAAKSALDSLTECLRMELAQSHPEIVVTTIFPGVVQTDFGLNALHGGPDNRKLPHSQTAEEVAKIIADAMLEKRADVYTPPGAIDRVLGYYKGLAG